MQYQKDAVKNEILFKALSEFNQKGYKGASVRSIAKNANTSVGNLYKYFKSKDDLFEYLIGSVYHKLIDLINQFNIVKFNNKTDEIFYNLMEKILEIFNENSTELTILLNKSEGSKYDKCKQYFIDFITKIVTQKMEYELSLKNKKLKSNFLISLISFNLIESIAIILREKEDTKEIRTLIRDIIDILYNDIANKLE